MLLTAEFRIGELVAGTFLNMKPHLLLEIGAGFLIATVIFGGMRSLTWTQCAQFIVVILGVSIPLIAISVAVTNLPLPQLAYGGILSETAQLEIARGVVTDQMAPLSRALPGADPAPIAHHFTALFRSLGAKDFLALTICIALGTAVFPAQIARIGTPPSISGVRKSFGWAALLVGLMVLTIPAYAAFVKYQVLKQLMGLPAAQIPDWGNLLSQLGLITLSANPLDPALGSAKIQFDRDTVALILPVISQFPFALVGVVGAAAIAAVLAAAGGQLVSLGNTLSNDVYYVFHRSASPARRLLVARIAMIAFAAALAIAADGQNLDPLRLMIWAASLCAGSFFVPLALTVWWKELSVLGAICGILAGTVATSAYILMTARGGAPWLGVDGLAAGLIGMPASALGLLAGSMLSPRPGPATLEIVDEMRIPSGETIHARLTRLAARGKAVKP
jgi:cation/acetate symporter